MCEVLKLVCAETCLTDNRTGRVGVDCFMCSTPELFIPACVYCGLRSDYQIVSASAKYGLPAWSTVI
jgi:hypothetical protein